MAPATVIKFVINPTTTTMGSPNGSARSSPFPSDTRTEMIKQNYSLKLPNLLVEDLGMEFEDLQFLGLGSSNIVFSYINKNSRSKYAIRISLFQAKDETKNEPGPNLKDQAAVLRFLRRQESQLCSIPKPVLVDASNNNRLGCPFMIQTFVNAESLYEIEKRQKLSGDEYRDIIQELAKLKKKLEWVRFSRSGTLCAEPQNHDGIDTGLFKSEGEELNATWPPNLTIYSWLNNLIDFQTQRYKALAVETSASKDYELNQLDCLRTIVSEMYSVGIFRDPRGVQRMSNAVLCHPDLHFGNLLADRNPDTGRFRITGVVDWDDATAKPLPLAREPPYWLWQPEESWDEDCDFIASEYWNLIEPQKKNIKRTFDAAMCRYSPGYWDDAYGTGLWIRRVAKLAMWGVSKDVQDYQMNWLRDEWIWHMEMKLGLGSVLIRGVSKKKPGSRLWLMARTVQSRTPNAVARAASYVVWLVGLALAAFCASWIWVRRERFSFPQIDELVDE